MIAFPFIASLATHWIGLPAWAKRAIGGAGMAMVLALAWLLWLHGHDHRVLEHQAAKVEARAAPARDAAADRRVQDAAANAKQEQTYHAAIDHAPDGAPGSATVALNCERLRRANAKLPAACGSASGDRAQAGTRP